MKDDEEIDELRRCVHIAVGTGGAEVLISSNDPKDSLDDILKKAKNLADRYYKIR
jgi:hypothetical protein